MEAGKLASLVMDAAVKIVGDDADETCFLMVVVVDEHGFAVEQMAHTEACEVAAAGKAARAAFERSLREFASEKGDEALLIDGGAQ